MDTFEIIPGNFCALPEELSRYDAARAVVIPVPYEGTTTYVSGTRFGPSAIVQASRNMETFDLDLEKEVCEVGISTLEELAPVCSSPADMIRAVKDIVGKVIDDDKFPLVLGGEHSITAGAVEAFAERRDDFSVIQFDAHLDLRESYQGTPFSHACVMRRIHEMEVTFVQVGIRSACREEFEFARSEAIPFFSPGEIRENPKYLKDAIQELKEHVYITFDVDGLDSSVIPSTGTPEPGGLFWAEAIRILADIAGLKTIIGADVVELSPVGGNVAPDFAAAKLAYKLIGFALCA
jgi:agmatinase